MKKRVADIIMEVLYDEGIKDCFAVVGGGSMHLDNALGIQNKINKVFNHHEQACAMAAEAYSRVNGEIAAVIITSGPGATNTLTGVMGAFVDSLPMIVLSGQVRYDLTVEKTGLPLRFRGGQEFNIVDTVKTMTKYSAMVKDPLAIRKEIKKAINIAMNGRRGPVWLDIPLDVQMAIVETDNLYADETIPSKVINEADLKDIIEQLNKAKRPVILAGNGIGVSGAINCFRELSDKLNVPVLAAAQASDVMYRENPNYYGMAGLIGWRSGNFIIQNADFILALGTSLGFKTTGYAQDQFANEAIIYMVDADENEYKKPGLHVNKFINAEINNLLQKWSLLDDNKMIAIDPKWRAYCDFLKKKFDIYEVTKNLDMNERVCSYYFWEKYDQLAPNDDITVLGNNTAISSKVQIGVLKEQQRTMTNDNCGSMGYDLPAAIGASVAAKRGIICVTGDGSIMMNLQELQTIKHYNLPVKIVIFSNDGYNAFRQTCKNFFNNKYTGCDSATGVSFPTFEMVAHAFKYQYRHCKTNLDVDESIKWLLNSENQVILEIDQRFDDPVTPKIMSRINEKGEFETPKLHDMYPFISPDELDELMVSKK